MFVLRNKLRKEKYNGRFLQEHGKTVFIAVCILLLVGVAYAIGPVISKAVQDVVGSYTTSVTFDSIAGKIPTAGK
mgnify:CR=1 FL=1